MRFTFLPYKAKARFHGDQTAPWKNAGKHFLIYNKEKGRKEQAMKTYAEYEEYYEKNLKDQLAGHPEISKEMWITYQWERDNHIDRTKDNVDYQIQRSKVLSSSGLPDDDRKKFEAAWLKTAVSLTLRYIKDLEEMGITDDEE